LSLARALALCLALAPLSGWAATITGRVVHPGNPETVDGLEVVLLGLPRGGEPIELTTQSDAEGRFRFDDVSPDAAYLVFADHAGIRFPGGSVTFDAAAPDAEQQTRDIFFHIYDTTSDPSGLKLQSIRWLLNRETGAYRIQQAAVVNNSSMKVVVADEGAPPFFLLGLAANHGELQGRFGTLPAGLSVHDGGVAVRGPIYPGERSFEFAYDLQDPGDRLQIDLDVPDSAEQVEVMVRDFGAEIEAGPLHPARPVRSSDQVYQRYVGFDLPAGTRIPLRVTPLPPLQPLPMTLRVLLISLIAGALCYYVVRPFATATEAGLGGGLGEDGAEAEKAALLTSLRDLEHDFETGKISAEDRDALREEVRREALEALSRARALEARSSAAGAGETVESPVTASCECGFSPRPGDRFCGGCGRPL
jgi:hypothetical protein